MKPAIRAEKLACSGPAFYSRALFGSIGGDGVRDLVCLISRVCSDLSISPQPISNMIFVLFYWGVSSLPRKFYYPYNSSRGNPSSMQEEALGVNGVLRILQVSSAL